MPDEYELRMPYSSDEADRTEALDIERLKGQSIKAIPDPDGWLDEELKKNILLTTVDNLIGWGRHYSTWPMNFGLACCAFEMISAAGARWDLSRFGMEIMRPSPRQADLMMVCGTVTWKMAAAVRRLYDQMAEPKWVLAMGACAVSGGTFSESYSVVPGVSRIIPVDVYVPGCPPRPEGLLFGITELHKKIFKKSIRNDFCIPGLD